MQSQTTHSAPVVVIPATLKQHHPHWVELYRRLQTFTVASYDHVPLSFHQRLMREHGWSSAYTERVWFEYKRFLFMLATTQQFICPAEDVDQIWHTHLIYTRSYWNDLCRDLLGKPLHHVPSPGGDIETASFYRDYAQTLQKYRELFGEVPPADIWVAPAKRLRDTPYLRLVNTRTYWLLPKPHLQTPKWLTWTSLLGGLVFIYTSKADASNFLKEANFTWLWLILLAWIIFSVVRAIRNRHRCPVCKQRHAFYKTGAVISNHPEEIEYRCNRCGHQEWRKQSEGGGSGGGGSGGGCGGSGGG